jgi:hypothetical protein
MDRNELEAARQHKTILVWICPSEDRRNSLQTTAASYSRASFDLDGSKASHMILPGAGAAEFLPIVFPVYEYKPAHLK